MVITKIEPKIYHIQKRTFRDAKWYNSWHAGCKYGWSEWSTFCCIDNVKTAFKIEDRLNSQKNKSINRVEYRLIKDGQ